MGRELSATAEAEIVIPYTPRPLQRELHNQLEDHRFSVAVCHRRFGKTVLAVNHLIKHAATSEKDRARYALIGPTYSQMKAVAWDYLKFYSGPIPGVEINESELRVDYPNGGRVRIFGADNPDALRGLYFDGVVFDEFGLQRPSIFTEIVRPALADRQGWALFMGTPNGHNEFWEMAKRAQRDHEWLYAEYRASETGVLSESELADSRSQMTADEYAQEYECSFEASVKGAIYALELDQARRDGRITDVPYDPKVLVDTDWDIGVDDATAIWFTQSMPSGAVRVIDYYEASNMGLQHYAETLRQKGYSYGTFAFPHDMEAREFTSGRARIDVARSLGMTPAVVVPKAKVEDGIHQARVLLPKCYFDATKCAAGLEALQNYKRRHNSRLRQYEGPEHDWASHGADGFRTLAMRHFTPKVERQVNAARRDWDPWDERVARNRMPAKVGGRGGW